MAFSEVLKLRTKTSCSASAETARCMLHFFEGQKPSLHTLFLIDTQFYSRNDKITFRPPIPIDGELIIENVGAHRPNLESSRKGFLPFIAEVNFL